MNPISTGSEMKSATEPSRRSEASRRVAPTNNVNVTEALSRGAGSPLGTTSPSSAPTRIASVVVVLTLSAREVPSKAYITIGTNAV